MKQRRIKELTINHYEHGASVAYTPSRTEEYAAVLAQAEAHQDLRFHTQINSVETLIILPWETVIGAYATYETADVTAPADAICCDEPGYSGVDLNGYTPSCVQVEADPDDPGTSWARVYFKKDGAEPFWSDRSIVGEPGQITGDGSIAYIKACEKSPETNIYGIMGTNSETEGYIKFIDPEDMETVIATYTTGVCE